MAVLTSLVRGLSAVLLGVMTMPAAAGSQDILEQDIRAAFLYNFTRFIDWPHEALPDDQFRICIMGDERLARAVDQIIVGETAAGRPLARLQVPSPDAARRCQILYVAASEMPRGAAVLTTLREAPVLTVSDGGQFLEHGGAIRFLLEQNRVRFDVSLPALQRARLSASSKLLRVARTVYGVGLP